MKDLMDIEPKHLIYFGFGLLFASWVLVFMMVIDLVGPTFTLIFLCYGGGVIGLFLGLLGIFHNVKTKPKKQRHKNFWEAEEEAEE